MVRGKPPVVAICAQRAFLLVFSLRGMCLYQHVSVSVSVSVPVPVHVSLSVPVPVSVSVSKCCLRQPYTPSLLPAFSRHPRQTLSLAYSLSQHGQSWDGEGYKQGEDVDDETLRRLLPSSSRTMPSEAAAPGPLRHVHTPAHHPSPIPGGSGVPLPTSPPRYPLEGMSPMRGGGDLGGGEVDTSDGHKLVDAQQLRGRASRSVRVWVMRHGARLDELVCVCLCVCVCVMCIHTHAHVHSSARAHTHTHTHTQHAHTYLSCSYCVCRSQCGKSKPFGPMILRSRNRAVTRYMYL